MKVVGVTGGIATGKSTAVQYLVSLDPNNIYLIDADKIGHETYKIGTDAYYKLVEHFGEKIITNPNDVNDKSIQRSVLGKIVFSDKNEMKKLQEIVWPEMKKMVKNLIETKKKEGYKVVIIEAAMLFEMGWQDLFDEIWCLVLDKEEARNRLMKRNNLSKEDADKRINAQMSNEERSKHSTVVIDTNTTIDEMKEKLSKLYKERLKVEEIS